MRASPFWIIRFALGVIVVCMGLASATLGFWASAQTKPEQSAVQAWFREEWIRIKMSSWLRLPEYVTASLIRSARIVALQLADFCVKHRKYHELFTGTGAVLVTGTMGFWVWPIRRDSARTGMFINAFMGSITGIAENDPLRRLLHFVLVLLFAGLGSYIAMRQTNTLPVRFPVFNSAVYSTMVVGMVSCTMYLPFWASALMILCLTPLAIHLRERLGSSGYHRVRFDPRILDDLRQRYIFGMTITVSILVTLCALALGRFTSSGSTMPRDSQMLVANIILDTLTITTSFRLLLSSVGKERIFPTSVAILLTLTCNGLFALASLWFGVLDTDFCLPFNEVLKIFVGRSPHGSGFEFGSYFWAMHTSFIPMLIYLTALSVCVAAKASLSVGLLFFGRAQHADVNPLTLTSRLFGLLAALASASLFVINVLT